MSLNVMAWAWKVKLPPSQKFVLMALADEADDAGFCFPSHRRIAQKCSLSDRSVRRMIAALSAAGYVAVASRFRNRARTSNGYQLAINHPRTNCPGGMVSGGQGDRTTVTRGPRQACPGAPDNAVRVTTTDPLVVPIPPPHGSATTTAQCGADAFSGGELCFPKSLSVEERRSIAKHLAGVSLDDAQQILDELGGRLEATKIRNPIRYCVELIRRFQRGAFQAELGLAIAERRRAERELELDRRSRETPEIRSTSVLPTHVQAALERIKTRARQMSPKSSTDCQETVTKRITENASSDEA
jgi:hypothetical protein